MSEHCGYIVQIKDLRKHTNADRLQIATIFGNNVVVDLNTHVGDVGVFFPVDLQLSERFCQVNDLVRRKDENGNQAGGFLEADKRNIRAIRLRGEKSEGLFMPLTCLADFCTISDLKVGDRIDVLNGEEICKKYIPRRNPNGGGYRGYHAHKPKVNFAPTFHEHIETEQLAYNLDKFRNGDIVQLTLKMHGTSGRTGYLPLVRFKKQHWWQKLLKMHPRQYLEYGYVTGTRRVVLSDTSRGGYYESDDFRHAMAKKFEGKLRRGEVVYYEIVGFQGPNGAPIMGQVQNSKIKDKEFSKKYGDVTTFSYGCDQSGDYEWKLEESVEGVTGDPIGVPPCCEVYVYRMTMVNEDGDEVDYSPAQIKARCEQMCVNVVPEFYTFIIPDFVQLPDDVGSPQQVNAGEYVVRQVERFFDGPDPIGKTHVREGVVARILNRPGFAVYKHKNFSFKVLSNIITDELTDEQADSLSSDILEEM